MNYLLKQILRLYLPFLIAERRGRRDIDGYELSKKAPNTATRGVTEHLFGSA